MDPQAAWDQMLAAFAAADWPQLDAHATALLNWLQRGGFPPNGCAAGDCQTVCLMARALAHAKALRPSEIPEQQEEPHDREPE